MPEKVLKLIEYENNGHLWTPVDALEDAAKSIKCKEMYSDGILMLFVDRRDNNFEVKWFQAQLKMSESIAAAEILKAEMTDLLRSK